MAELTPERRSQFSRMGLLGARARWDSMTPEQRKAHRATWKVTQSPLERSLQAKKARRVGIAKQMARKAAAQAEKARADLTKKADA